MRKILLLLGIISLLAMASVYAETISYDDFECNGFGCGTGWNNNWTNTGTVEITTLSSPQGIYMLRATGGGNATRNFDNTGYTATSISFWATATSLEATDFCRYYYYDGATYTQILQIADGQDTGTLQYYTYNVTPVNANAGIRVQAVGSTGDYCYIDTITTSGTISAPSLNIILDAQYPIGKTNIEIDMTSTQTNTNYTLKLYDSSNNLFCEKNIVSPSVAQTIFSTYCNMPNSTHTNAYAVLYDTNTPSNNITQYFNIVNYQQDYGKLKISQVYYSPQVLQGSSTEIFAVIDTLGLSISKLYVTITFPDNATRKLSMERTINEGEYRAFITDTFRTTWTTFEIRVESGIYYDTYINSYYVVPFSVEYVANVGSVATVTNPVTAEMPSIKLHGTEYIPGDDGKLFLQFLDADQQPVNNSECFLSLWYPNSSAMFNNTLMSYLSEGIYYKNFLVPSITGVYPASAKCYRPITFNNMVLYNQTYDNFESNSFIGGSGWAICPLGDPDCQNGWDYDTLKTSIVASAAAGTGGCFGNTGYCARIDGSYGFLERGFPNEFMEGTVAYNITFKYKFLNFQTNELAEVYVFDGNWHLLEQIGLTPNRTNGVWYNASYYIDDTEFNLETILLGFFAYTMPSSNDYFFVDDVYIHYTGTNITLSNETQYQILRGSGEVHISNSYNNLVNLTNNISTQVWNYPVRNLTYYPAVNNTAIAQEVWNYTTRNLTYYPPQVDMTNYTRIDQTIYAINQSISTNMLSYYTDILNFIPGLVWNYTNRNLTYYPPATIDYEQVAANVWNYTNRNLTYYPTQVDLTNYTLINQGVWEYTNRTLTYYEHIDMTNYTLINEGVWTYTTRNLTYYPAQEDLTNYTNVAVNVWTYITRNLTYYPPVSNLTAQDVWEYVNRNLTYYPTQVDLTNYSAINEGVWMYSVRNLTYYEDKTNYTQITDTVPTAVWTYTTRNLTYYPAQVDLTNYSRISNLTAQEVWEYTNRNLTYYPPAFVNTTEVAIAVWDYTTRNLTYYPPQADMTNYSLIGVYVWNATTRDLTYYEHIDMTNYSLISNLTAQDVWTYIDRNLTYYQNFSTPQVDMTNYTLINEGVSAAVWVYTTRNLTYYAPAFVDNDAIAVAVWNATTRNLTYYPAQTDLTNYSLINQGVWTYNDRNLTYYPPQVDLTNYSAIESGVWTYTNRNLTYYPTQADLTNYTLINEGVWTYVNRNLTYYPPQIDMTNYSGIAANVWNYTTRDLTYYQINNITASDVWNYINRTLTYYEVNNITTTDIWTYNNRTLTYYPTQTDQTNYTAIWEYPNRNLTYYEPAYVNTTAIAEDTWNYTARYTHGVILN